MPEVVDVVVIGAGAAGLMAACAAAPHCHTQVITDRAIGACNSAMAQGGLQVPLPDDESRERFVADMLRSARVEVDERYVRHFVAHVGDTVAELQRWGLELDRDADGEVIRRRAGGLSDPRIVSSGDSIGPALMRVLRDHVASLDVGVHAHSRVQRVLPAGSHLVLTVVDADGAPHELRARAVVAATGGLTFRVAHESGEATTNPRNENHVLYEALRDLGLERVHEDYFQFQPFGIVSFDTGSVGRCVPESIVNHPVRLLDRHGDVVCDLTRDRLAVTEAMRESMRLGNGYTGVDGRPGILLTLSDVPSSDLHEHFPKLAALLERHDASDADVVVRPFLHYQLGGFRTGPEGVTAVPGLLLAGEMTGGLHGRNRLMGNGITDSLVHGRLAGRAAAALVHGGAGIDVSEEP